MIHAPLRAVAAIIVILVVLPLDATKVFNNFNTAATFPYQPYARGFTAAAITNASNMVIFGGYNYTCACSLGRAWMWRTQVGLWLNLEPLTTAVPTARSGATLSFIPGGPGLLLFGGVNQPANHSGPTLFNTLWRLDANHVDGTVAYTLLPQLQPRPAPRERHLAFVVNVTTPQLFVFGGLSVSSAVLDDLWQYEPSLNRWERLYKTPTDWPAARYEGQSSVVDGIAYLGGGLDSFGAPLSDLWRFNASQVTWTPLASLTAPFVDPTTFTWQGSAAYDGNFFVFGAAFSTLLLESYAYSPSTDTWTVRTTTSMPLNMRDFATLGTSKYIVLFGGEQIGGIYSPTSQIWAYHPSQSVNQWESLDPPSQPPQRQFHLLSMLSNGLFTFGGSQTQGPLNMLSDSWILDSESRWRQLAFPVVPPARRSMAWTTWNDRVYMFGGFGVSGPINDSWTFEFETGWQSVTSTGDVPGVCASAVGALLTSTMGAPLMLMFGGGNFIIEDRQPITYEWNLQTLHWTSYLCPHTPRDRIGHGIASVRSGTQALLFAGQVVEDAAEFILNDLWLYDAATHLWTELFPSYRPQNRTFFAMVSIPSKVFVFGGRGTNGIIFNDMWQFDVITEQWYELVTTDRPAPLYAVKGVRSIDVNATSTQVVTLIFFGGPGPFAGTLEFTPACELGTSSRNFFSEPCLPCEVGTFSPDLGMNSCLQCPVHASTPSTGSVDQSDCSVCDEGACHAGQCRVLSQGLGILCDCPFGYLASDHCQTPWVIIGIVAFFLLVGCIVIITLVARRSRKLTYQHSLYERLLDDAHEEVDLSRAHVAELERVWHIPESELSDLALVDSGAFGDVYQAHWSGRVVAVKMLRRAVLESDSLASQEFDREVRFLRSVRHPNLVLFFGSGVTSNQVPFLVTEYLEYGSLYSILYGDETERTVCEDLLPMETRLRFAVDAAKGMRFLHGLVPPIMHRDLKSRNLLVGHGHIVKVADFGTARLLCNLEAVEEEDGICGEGSCRSRLRQNPKTRDGLETAAVPQASLSHNNRILTTYVGTLLWQSPEILKGATYGAPADVYSFGIVLYELLERRLPFEELENTWDVEEAVTRGQRPHFYLEDATYESIRVLIEQCWHSQPRMRPSFVRIVDQLEELQVSIFVAQCDAKDPKMLTRSQTSLTRFPAKDMSIRLRSVSAV